MAPHTPPEILLSIFEEVFALNAHEGKAGNSSRLDIFRNLASVHRAWADPARAVFWYEVELTEIKKLVSFSSELDVPTARRNCIRKFSFCISSDVKYPQEYDDTYLYSSILNIIQKIPTHLQVYRMGLSRDTWGTQSPLIYRCWARACNAAERIFQVNSLQIDYRPLACEILRIYGNVRGITELRLRVSTLDRPTTFTRPFVDMHLKSLSIDIDWTDCMVQESAHQLGSTCLALADILRPACTNLQSLTLTFWYRTREKPRVYTNVFRHLQALGHETITRLSLINQQVKTTIDPPFLDELATESGAISRSPNIRELVLREFGVSSAALHQLGCVELRELDVVVIEQGLRNGAASRDALLEGLHLTQMAKLERLRVEFGDLGALDREDDWVGTEDAWAPLEEFCAAKGIACEIIHPPKHVEEIYRYLSMDDEMDIWKVLYVL